MNKIIYKNLGSNSGNRMMYIRSTDIEQGNWVSLLMSFPDEALYYMTKGKHIVIEDKCSKKHGKVQRIFCPAFSDFLRLLNNKNLENKLVLDHTKKALKVYKENKTIKRKYDFFKRKLNIYKVRGRTIFVKKEPTVWSK